MEKNSNIKDVKKVENSNDIESTETQVSNEELTQENIQGDIQKENIQEESNKSLKPIKSKKSASSIFLYIISLIFLGYMCFNIYDTYNYITELISYGSIDPSSQMRDIVSYYVGTCSPYAFYAITTWALGLLIDKATKVQNKLLEI